MEETRKQFTNYFHEDTVSTKIDSSFRKSITAMAKCTSNMASLILMVIIATSTNGIKPPDIEVLVHDSAYISCSPNASIDIQWHFNSFYNYVFAGGRFFIPYRGRFQIETNSTTGNYILIIPDVKPGDAGEYFCSEEISGFLISSTHLTVLYSDPVCNSTMGPDGFVAANTCNLQQENMTFDCSVSFSGKTPHLIWKSLNNSQNFNSTVCDYQSNRINCSLILRPDPVYHGSVFVCETEAQRENRHKCSTEIIKIWYFFAEYSATEKKVNENVSCVVRSNLNVKYNWTLKQDTEETYLSSNRMIFIREPGIYQCEVEYSIRNTSCSALVSDVNISTVITNISTEKGINVLEVTLPVVAVLIIVIVVIAAVFSLYIIRRERRKRRDLFEQELRELQERELLERGQNLSQRKREDEKIQRKLENERIKNRVINTYKDFIKEMDPKYVLDLLIQKRVINVNFKEELMAKDTGEERCRALLEHLIYSSNDESFIVFRETLKEHYPRIVERIDACDETGGTCNTALVKFLKKLQLPESSSDACIHGVAKLSNRIYILCSWPKYVVVFEDRIPFERLDIIPIEEIGFPFDIASSRKSECLYISDNPLRTIWEKKTTDDSPLTRWFFEPFELTYPDTLFISNDDRLLVLDHGNPARIVIFGLDGKVNQILSFPVEIESPVHCIEKPSEGFIVTCPFKICELSSDGKYIIRQYPPNDASEELDTPWYMSLDYDNDLLFVADKVNDRVILIDSNSLQLKDIIITQLCVPHRLLYDSNKEQLIVNPLNEGVNVYKVYKASN